MIWFLLMAMGPYECDAVCQARIAAQDALTFKIFLCMTPIFFAISQPQLTYCICRAIKRKFTRGSK